MKMGKILMLLCFGLIMASISVMGANQNVTQENITTSLTVFATPVVGTVLLEDSDDSVVDELDPTPNSTFVVTCNATVTDLDGDTDLNESWGYIHANGVAYGDPDDDLNHYTNNTCSIITGAVDNDAVISCDFNVIFYADNSQWTCTLFVNDSQSLEDSNTDTSTMTDLLAIDVADGNIDFGSLNVGSDSGGADYSKTLYNIGNIDMGLKLNTWGSSLGDGRSMTCTNGFTLPGDIRAHYNTGQFWDTQKQNLTSTGDDGTEFDDGNGVVTIAHQTSGITGSTDLIHFGMGVSTHGNTPSGSCTGNIMFTAIEK